MPCITGQHFVEVQISFKPLDPSDTEPTADPKYYDMSSPYLRSDRLDPPEAEAQPTSILMENAMITSLKAGANEVLMESYHRTGDHGNRHRDAAGTGFYDLLISSLATRSGGEPMTADSHHHRHGHHGHRSHGGDGATAGCDVRIGPAC